MIRKSIQVEFTKMVASGNDFLVVHSRALKVAQRLCLLTKSICDRKYGIGADGMLLLGPSKSADIRMRIFNADGSEADMCGNGARCAALFMSRIIGRSAMKLETKAGTIKAQIKGEKVKIKLTPPKAIRLDMPLGVSERLIKVNCINTGVPHTVIFVEGIEKIDVATLGRAIRFHKHFSPAGTNVNFVQIDRDGVLKVRTYERGVEDETLACGTGSTAAALIYALKTGTLGKVLVKTRSTEKLTVYFSRINRTFSNVWLEGKAHFVAQGIYYF